MPHPQLKVASLASSCVFGGREEKDEEDVSSKRESTARKVLNFNAVNDSVDDINKQQSLLCLL